MKKHIQEHGRKMIKCITFDLDDTLWAVDPVVSAANQTLYDWLAHNAPLFVSAYQVSDFMGQLKERVLKVQPEIAHSVTQIRLAVLEEGLASVGYSQADAKALAESGFQVFLEARQQVTFFEHALAMLDELKAKGYQLGAISNGNAKIEFTGLSHCMDFQLNADEAGVEKPHPDIFHQVLESQKLRPEQVIHIGDNPVADVQGANDAGLWSIWVNLKGEAWAHGHKPSQEVRCLTEIPAAIDLIEQQKRAQL